MTKELITPENLSKELLMSAFDEASIETVYTDKENGLIVKLDFEFFVLYEEEEYGLVMLKTLVYFKPETPELLRLQTVNSINNDNYCIKAGVVIHDGLFFTWEISIDGGITQKAFVDAVMRFYYSLNKAIESAENVISSVPKYLPAQRRPKHND